MTIAAAVIITVSAYASDGSYEKGVAYLRAGKADEALRILAPLAAKEPRDPYLQYHAGLAYYKAGRFDEASDSLVRAKDAATSTGVTGEFNFAAAFANLGSAYYKAKDFVKSEMSLTIALVVDPADGDARYYMGLVKAEKKEFAAALTELEKARAAKAGDAAATALIRNAGGRIWYGQERYPDAMQEFSAALEADPDNFEALYYLSIINYKENGYSAAKPYFDRIVLKEQADEKTKDALSTAFFNIGVDYQNRDQAGLAAEMFERAIKIRPNDADAHYYKGYNLFSLERYEEAATEFRQALALRPDMARARAQLEVAQKASAESALKEARDAYARGELGASVDLFEKATSLDPSNSDAAKGLKVARAGVDRDIKEKSPAVRAALAKGELSEAKELCGQIIRAYPGNRQAAELEKEVSGRVEAEVGSMKAKAKDAMQREALGEASGWYEKIITLDPSEVAAAKSLSQAKARIQDERAKGKDAFDDGRLSAARKAYEKLVKYLPDDLSARKGLNDTLARIAAENTRIQEAEAAAARAFQERQAVQPAASEEEVRRLYLEGVENYTKGELREAVAKWREVLKLDPKNEKAAGSLAKVEEKIKETTGKTAK